MSISFLDLPGEPSTAEDQQEQQWEPHRGPGVAGKMLKGIDGAGWARAVGSRLHTPLQLLTVAKALLPE